MIGETWQLVEFELVEFEKWPIEVQDFIKIIDHYRGINLECIKIYFIYIYSGDVNWDIKYGGIF